MSILEFMQCSHDHGTIFRMIKTLKIKWDGVILTGHYISLKADPITNLNTYINHIEITFTLYLFVYSQKHNSFVSTAFRVTEKSLKVIYKIQLSLIFLQFFTTLSD